MVKCGPACWAKGSQNAKCNVKYSCGKDPASRTCGWHTTGPAEGPEKVDCAQGLREPMGCGPLDDGVEEQTAKKEIEVDIIHFWKGTKNVKILANRNYYEHCSGKICIGNHGTYDDFNH